MSLERWQAGLDAAVLGAVPCDCPSRLLSVAAEPRVAGSAGSRRRILPSRRESWDLKRARVSGRQRLASWQWDGPGAGGGAGEPLAAGRGGTPHY